MSSLFDVLAKIKMFNSSIITIWKCGSSIWSAIEHNYNHRIFTAKCTSSSLKLISIVMVRIDPILFSVEYQLTQKQKNTCLLRKIIWMPITCRKTLCLCTYIYTSIYTRVWSKEKTILHFYLSSYLKCKLCYLLLCQEQALFPKSIHKRRIIHHHA